MCGKTLRGTALQTERFQWEKCVFLVILGLEIHIFVVNVHFFPGRGQHLPGKCVFSPKSGNLCRVFKRYMEGSSAGYRMAGEKSIFQWENVYFWAFGAWK